MIHQWLNITFMWHNYDLFLTGDKGYLFVYLNYKYRRGVERLNADAAERHREAVKLLSR